MVNALRVWKQPSAAGSDNIRLILLRSIRMWVAESQTSVKVSEKSIEYWSAIGVSKAAYYVDGFMWALPLQLRL